MIYSRQLIQYNDLVFEGVSLLRAETYPATYKSFDEEYSFGHGSYSPYKSEFVFAEAQSISVSLTLRMQKLPCEVRQFYKPFVTTQLARYGKLWSIENNTVEWAYAQISEKTERESNYNELNYDVTFFLPEGVWHKANPQKTFLVPHDPCMFMDCYNYKEIQPCINGDCMNCGKEAIKYCRCCDCDGLEKDMALCYKTGVTNGKSALQAFYNCDGAGWRIVYSCQAGEKFFGDYLGAEALGQKFCGDCGIISGLLYSDTEIETRNVRIRLHGNVKDPVISINGNANQIKGEYDGTLIINPDRSVYFDSGCGICDPLDIEKWVVPCGNSAGWVIHPQNNGITISGGCGAFCAYIEVDAITV